MDKPILVGITGRYGTGKNTLADMLAAEIPGARVVAFADRLKRRVHDMLADRLGAAFTRLTDDQLGDLKGDCLGPIYQGYGEVCRRLLRQDHWVLLMEDALPNRAIVADVRHPNEAEWIKRRGGLLVAVSGPCRRPGDTRDTEHPSERHVPEIARGADVAVLNDYTLDSLRTQARGVARLALAWAGGA